MEGGIGPDHTGQITDPDYRYELYEDWKSIISREPNYDIRVYCRDKSISLDAFLKTIEKHEN